jgi:pre-mRNA-processing factor 39
MTASQILTVTLRNLHVMSPQDDIQHIRAAYDAFLERYPLCYGYWKKYAAAEQRHGSSGDTDAAAAAGGSSGGVAAAAAVYQRGVAAVPHSPELWVAYASLLQGSDAATDDVRRWVSDI